MLNAKDSASGPIGNVNRALGELGRSADSPTSKFKGLASGVASFVTGAGLAVFGATQLAQGIGGLASSLFSGNVAFENTRAQLMAFTKDGAVAESILADIRTEAAKTPFAFQELANATAGLIPASRQAGVALMDLVRDAEILAASNPAEGLEGAAFALREAVSGDFTSVIERFNLPRAYINKLKEEGVPALEIVRRAMAEMGYDMDLVSNLSQTASGRWSTLMDTFSNLKNTLMQGIFTALSDEMVNLQGWLDRNQPRLEAFASTIGNGLAAAARLSIDGIKALVDLLRGPMAYAWVLIRDAVITFRDAWRGDWVDNDAVRPLHRLAGFLGGAFRYTFTLVRDAIITFKQALSGNWEDDSNIRPLHRIVGNLGTILREHVIPAIRQFAGFIVDSVVPAVGDFIERVQRVVDAFQEHGFIGGLQQYAEELYGFWSGIAEWLVDTALPWLVKALGKVGAAFVDWVTPYIPVVLEKLGELVGQLVDWLTGDGWDMLSEAVKSWSAAFIAWATPKVEDLIAKGEELVAQFGDWLTGDGVDKLAKNLLEWGKAFVEWATPLWEELSVKFSELVSLIGEWIVTTALPAIAGKLSEWAFAFSNWVTAEAIPALIEKLQGLWDNHMSPWITDTALPAIKEKMTEWANAFQDWITNEVVPTITGKLDDLWDTMRGWITDTALPKIKEKMTEWANAFLDWVKDEVIPSLGEKMDAIVTKIGEWVTDNKGKAKDKMVDIGIAVLEGIASGIRGSAGAIIGAAIDYVVGLLPEWVKKGLGISSPSKVMIPIGEMVSAGLAVGISNGVGKYIEPVLDDLAEFLAGYPIPVPAPIYPGGPGYGGFPGVPGGPLPPSGGGGVGGGGGTIGARPGDGGGGGVGGGGGTIGARPGEDTNPPGEVGSGVSTGPVPSTNTLQPNQVSNSRDAGAKGSMVATIDLASAQMQGSAIAQALEMRLVPALEAAVERGIRRAMAGVM